MKIEKIPFVHTYGNEVFCSTIDLFLGFGYKKHNQLKRVIESHLLDFEDFGKIQLHSVEESRSNNPEKTYHLNEQQFTFLCLLVKNSPNALKIKKAIAKEFHELRNYLPERTLLLKSKRQAHNPMMDALKELRMDDGKEMRDDIYQTENKLCNFIVIHRFIGVCKIGGEDGLSNWEVDKLAEVRKRNEAYILAGLDYKTRKAKLLEFSKKYDDKTPNPSPRVPFLELV